jgi:hypothetical protein
MDKQERKCLFEAGDPPGRPYASLLFSPAHSNSVIHKRAGFGLLLREVGWAANLPLRTPWLPLPNGAYRRERGKPSPTRVVAEDFVMLAAEQIRPSKE